MRVNLLGNTCNSHYELAKHLRSLGIDAHLYYDKNLHFQTQPESHDPELLKDWPDWLHPHTYLTDSSNPFHPEAASQLLPEISNCDILQVEDVGLVWASLTGKPYVWLPYGSDVYNYPFYRYWRLHNPWHPNWALSPLAMRRAMAEASAIVLGVWDVTLRDGYELIEELNPQAEIARLFYPLDTQRFSPGESRTIRELLRASNSEVEPEGITLFAPARVMISDKVDGYKANDMLYRALRKVHEDNIPFTLICIQRNGPDEPQAKEMFKEFGYSHRVAWIPVMPRHALTEWYQAADIVIDEFGSGAFGSIVTEGMASGGVLMGYLRSSSPDITYWPVSETFSSPPPLLNASSEAEITEWIHRVHKDPSFVQNLRSQSRDWVKKEIDGPVMAAKFISLYERVLSRETIHVNLCDSLKRTSEAKRIEGAQLAIAAEIKSNEGKLEEARLLASQALDILPYDTKSILTLIKSYRRTHDIESTLLNCLQAILISPQDTELLNGLEQMFNEPGLEKYADLVREMTRECR